jgi:AcrR family transcriptional regulator
MTSVSSTPVRKAQRRGRPKVTEGASDTRVALLDAAEKLFSERGFYGVTTREVAATASLDDAMIYYHFESKRGLFDAVLERRAGVVHDARLQSLATYVAAVDGRVSVEGAVAAFINPLLDLSAAGDLGWKSYFALVAQLDNTPWGGEIIHRFFDPAVQALIDILRRALPGSPDEDLYWAYNFLAGSMMMALAETERVDRLSDGLCRAKDIAAMRQRLIDYCAGGVLQLVRARVASLR